MPNETPEIQKALPEEVEKAIEMFSEAAYSLGHMDGAGGFDDANEIEKEDWQEARVALCSAILAAILASKAQEA